MNGNLRVLRDEPRFARLLVANLITGIGNWFNTVAVLALLLRLTGSGLAVGAALALQVFPRLIAGPVAGVLADRFPRKTILVATDLASTALALTFLLVTGPDRVWIVYAGSLLLVLSGILNAPARSAVIPALVLPENLLAANALNGAVSGSVMLAGAVLGGVASGAFGPQVAFVLNALSFLLSAALVASIRVPRVAGAAKTARAALAELGAVLRETPLLRAILLLAVLWPLGGGILNVLVSVYAVEVFHAGNAGVGLLYGAIGLGLLLGSVLARRIAGHERAALVTAILVEGVCQVLMSRAPQLAPAALVLALGTTGAGIGNACDSYLLMRLTPQPVLGRMFATISTLSSVTFGASLLGAGALLGVVPPRTLGLWGGLLILATGVLGAVLVARSPMPLPVAEELEPTREELAVADQVSS